jgi:MFS family permease
MQMIVARVAGPAMARVISVVALPIMLGPLLGPPLAAIVLQNASWRWLFFMNVPIGIAATGLAWRMLPEEKDGNRRSLDGFGLLLASLGLVMLLDSMHRMVAGQIVAGMVEMLGGLTLFGLFVRRCLGRGDDALVDLRLFKAQIFRAAVRTQFFNQMLQFGGQLLLPLYYITVRGAPVSVAAWSLTTLALGSVCGISFVGRLTDRLGPRRVCATASTLCMIGTSPFVFSSGHLPYSVLGCALFIRGVGISGINVPAMSVSYGSVPREALNHATTAVNIVQRLGGPVGTTLLALALQLCTAHPDWARAMTLAPRDSGEAPALAAFRIAFALLCGLNLLTVLSALALPVRVAEPVQTKG